VVRRMSAPKFLTLTLRRRALTKESVRRLRLFFTRLRHRDVWIASGGIYQIEIGTLDDLGMCNLHIHAIIDSEWMSQEALSEAWHDITGDSFVVDISAVKSDRQAIAYMSKDLTLDRMTNHLSKSPGELSAWQHDLINYVLRGSRLVQGFGTLARLGLSLRDPVCPYCGAVASLVCVDFDPCLCDRLEDSENLFHPAVALSCEGV